MRRERKRDSERGEGERQRERREKAPEIDRKRESDSEGKPTGKKECDKENHFLTAWSLRTAPLLSIVLFERGGGGGERKRKGERETLKREKEKKRKKRKKECCIRNHAAQARAKAWGRLQKLEAEYLSCHSDVHRFITVTDNFQHCRKHVVFRAFVVPL